MIKYKDKILMIDGRQKVSFWTEKTARNVLKAIRINEEQIREGSTKIEINFSKRGLRLMTEDEYKLWIEKGKPDYLKVSYEKGVSAELSAMNSQVTSLKSELEEKASREAELLQRIAELEQAQNSLIDKPEPLINETEKKKPGRKPKTAAKIESEVAK